LQPTPDTGRFHIAALAPYLVTIGDRVAGLLAAGRLLHDAVGEQ